MDKNFINNIGENKKGILKMLPSHMWEYLHKPETWWDDVIFADESKYNVFGSDGRVIVWRKPNEELQPQNLRPTVKHGNGKVMVWGCMGATGVGKLVFIDGIINKESYLNILCQNLKNSANKLGILESFKFYQDNDPKHKSRLVQEWLLYNCPKVLHPPAQYPDNPIENLWDELDRRIRKHTITSIYELKSTLQEEWHTIPAAYTA
ncbi:unnamed protein product [Euphydryas editha]|uniref:Transposable element Tc1 transposase n=1 Tax=Euphydryas editha TaxID=104508 RepID=A0AAU9TX85_EUPED|nr:unnamed protein product [Euphydryas editha]